MIPVFASEPPQPVEAALFRAYESVSENTTGCIIIERRQPTATVISRTVAHPDTLFDWSYTAATGASLKHSVSGLAVQVAPASSEDDRVPSMLAEIKRMTGWTWERLASALGRTRQAVHRWTLGREITPANAERIARLHAVIAYFDRGNAEDNQKLLNMEAGNGRIAGDLLDEGKFEEARALLERGSGARDVSAWSELADKERLATEEHWFDRLKETGGSEATLEIVEAPGKKRRVAVRRG